MNPQRRFTVAVVVLIVGLVAFSGWMASGRRAPESPSTAFFQAVDLSALGSIAVHSGGRLKSFSSFAHERMGWVMGTRRFRQQTPAFTYLDLMFRPEVYEGEDIIFVKNKNLRADIRRAFESSDLYESDRAGFEDRLEGFIRWGLISEPMLAEPEVQLRMNELEQDLMRSARFVQAVNGALNTKHPGSLAYELRLVPPASGGEDEPWSSLDSTGRPANILPDAEQGERLASAWAALARGWSAQDAVAVNLAASQVANILPSLAPSLYPDLAKLSWESWYFQNKNMTWIWMVYLLSVVLLLLFLVYRWRSAGWLGLSVFGLAFLLQTSALGLRWWVSGRWPNSNMFEAVTTSAWMGGCAAIAFEWFARRTAMAKVFALTSATASMVALMSANFLPLQLNPNIGNMMPVLHDIWLYIHTNIIIWSYILIFMAAITGLLYLVHRACGAQRESLRMAGATMASTSSSTNLGTVLDGVTMALMKLSFVMLWAGLVMGAIWADHSWGRPWGWDPKEVFALCTFIIFALLVHVRLKVQDKGLWTASLAVVGAGVMMFNWIVINFYISGLHSYA
ncbi:MAG: cytochrome c biogenesis protein CcsA [Planctomycetota bacterium]|jgi:cytochrome c-type biogenesis protein CcsB|nr:cytochrome c biogenesis protein CcsA [Planctomycetota bacterium]